MGLPLSILGTFWAQVSRVVRDSAFASYIEAGGVQRLQTKQLSANDNANIRQKLGFGKNRLTLPKLLAIVASAISLS